jgi:hypothetical protein
MALIHQTLAFFVLHNTQTASFAKVKAANALSVKVVMVLQHQVHVPIVQYLFHLALLAKMQILDLCVSTVIWVTFLIRLISSVFLANFPAFNVKVIQSIVQSVL